MTIADQARENAMHCEAKKHAYRQTQDGVVVSFVLHPHDVPEGLATAPLGSRYVLALVQVDDNELPVQKEARATPRPVTSPDTPTDGAKREKLDWRDVQPAAQAGMRCDKPEFWAFLREEKKCILVNDPVTAAAAVRDLCCVNSRSELSTDHRKRVLWHQLDSQFSAWLAKERCGA